MGVEQGGYVLVVEDNRMVQMLTREVLSREGLESEGARSGAAARELISQRLPGVIVLDIQLPDTDGFALAREFKADARTAEVPIVVVSGRDLESDRDLARELGCADYMVKPIDIQVFGRRLRGLLGQRATS